jgi:hypothetical protein
MTAPGHGTPAHRVEELTAAREAVLESFLYEARTASSAMDTGLKDIANGRASQRLQYLVSVHSALVAARHDLKTSISVNVPVRQKLGE